MEGCTHEKKIPYGDLDFEFYTQKYWILRKEFLGKILVFSENSYKGISFENWPPLTFLSKILRFSEISFKGISFIKMTQEATLG